jgi:hypothetical protein
MKTRRPPKWRALLCVVVAARGDGGADAPRSPFKASPPPVEG